MTYKSSKIKFPRARIKIILDSSHFRILRNITKLPPSYASNAYKTSYDFSQNKIF
ncbi:hypothetical protein [Helicobacter sp. T3_23-1056]